MLKIYMIIKRLIKKFFNMMRTKNIVKENFINFISDVISKPNVIFEIGSRDAIQSIEFSKLFPKAKIYAFECYLPSIKTCIENTKNYKNIEIVPYAVFNKNKKMDFYPISSKIGASSLFKISNEHPLKCHQKEKITVDAIRIDDWAKRKGINKIDLVWIDLQGAEYEAFEGMGKYLQNIQAIYSEVEIKELYTGQKLMKDVTRLLNEKGFSLLKYTQTKSAFLWGNAIYINNMV